MAKKDPTELSVEEKLKTLYQLQTTLSAIDEKKALRGELPLEVQDLEDEIEGLTIRIDKIKREIDEFQKAVSQKKAEINEAQASVERYKEQLNDVKNNREYDTLSKEIEFQTLEIELCNKKIREAQTRIEEKTNELHENEEAIKDRQSDLDIKKSELDEIMEETRAEEEKLKEKVTELAVAHFVQTHTQERPQRTGNRLRAARRLRRMLQQDSPTEAAGHQDAQENHCLRILRTHHS